MKSSNTHDYVLALEKEVDALRSQLNAISDHQTQLELVIKSTGVGIWDWQVQTGHTEFNERWANIIGYTLEELAPISIQNLARLRPPRGFSRVRASSSRALGWQQ